MKRTRDQLTTLEPQDTWSRVFQYLELSEILTLIMVAKSFARPAAISARCLELAERPMTNIEYARFLLQAYILRHHECISMETYARLDNRPGHCWSYVSLGFLQSKSTKKTKRPSPKFCFWSCLALLNRPNAIWRRWDYKPLVKEMRELALPLGMCKRIVRRYIQYSEQANELIDNLIAFHMPIELIKFALQIEPIQKRFSAEFIYPDIELDLEYLEKVDRLYNVRPVVQRQLVRWASEERSIANLYHLLSFGVCIEFFQVYKNGLTDDQLGQLLNDQNPTLLKMESVRSAQVADWMIKQPVQNQVLVRWANELLKNMTKGSRTIFEISAGSRLKILVAYVSFIVELSKRTGQTRLQRADALLVALIRNLSPIERELLMDRLHSLALTYDTRYWLAHIYYSQVPPRRFLRYPLDLNSEEPWVLKYNTLKLLCEKKFNKSLD